MGLLTFEHQILGNWQASLKEGEKFTIRRQQCGDGKDTGCNHVLAFQFATNLNEQSQADYYVVDSCVWLEGEPHLLYRKERWFGNFVRCPVCGREGKLPMDKPLNWELMQESREVKNGVI